VVVDMFVDVVCGFGLVFDVGCGLGIVIGYFYECGFDVLGVDLLLCMVEYVCRLYL